MANNAFKVSQEFINKYYSGNITLNTVLNEPKKF